MSSGRVGKAIVLTCFFTAGTGNWGWVFARPVTASTGVNGNTGVYKAALVGRPHPEFGHLNFGKKLK